VFKQTSDTVSASTAPADPVQQARTRARQRLIGAIVLLAVGIIGFPLVFETQPRPIPIDIPIEIPKKDALAPLPAPPPTSGSGATASRSRPEAAAPARPAEEIVTESSDESGREVPSPEPAKRSASATVVAKSASAVTPATRPAGSPPSAAARVAAAPPSTPPRPVASAPAPAVAKAPDSIARPAPDGDRARALLEGKAAPTAASAPSGEAVQRFVVQVGAFADAEAARETRLKVEKLGLKTYTQVAQTAGGSRIRVRVGPFASRGDAEGALAKAKAAGIPAVVLTL
jgi:DedD protein